MEATANNATFREAPAPYRTSVRFPTLRDPKYPVHRIAHRVEPYLSHIVERFHPRRIILFGSQIYGEPRWDSDVDVLVVRDDMASENAGTKEIWHCLHEVEGDRPAFTILAKSSSRIAERLTAKSPFYEDIIGKGLEVYAA